MRCPGVGEDSPLLAGLFFPPESYRRRPEGSVEIKREYEGESSFIAFSISGVILGIEEDDGKGYILREAL